MNAIWNNTAHIGRKDQSNRIEIVEVILKVVRMLRLPRLRPMSLVV